MRILIVHNQLWAHYKSKLFSEINNCLSVESPTNEFLVTHIALHEASRSVMKDTGDFQYNYPYKVLFDRSLDEVGFTERLFALIKEFNSFKPTILNVTGYFDWAQVLLMVYARAKGIKVVLSSESSSADGNRSLIKEKIKSWILSNANAFFCFGKTSADYLVSLGVRSDQLKVSDAAVVDEDVIKANYELAKAEIDEQNRLISTKHNFVFVGRLAHEKNLEMLVNAFIKIKKEISDSQQWGLIFVGDGPSRLSLESLASKSNISESIHFVGGCPWYKVPNWLAYSDILVLPSLSEPWGLVVNEAMVCGMPVIVSEKCGCAEDLLQNGINGFKFNPTAQIELENALRFFIENPQKISEMGVVSQTIIKRFSSKNVAAEMVAAYKSLS